MNYTQRTLFVGYLLKNEEFKFRNLLDFTFKRMISGQHYVNQKYIKDTISDVEAPANPHRLLVTWYDQFGIKNPTLQSIVDEYPRGVLDFMEREVRMKELDEALSTLGLPNLHN